MKVVINGCYGGFSISTAAVKWIRENLPCEHIETLSGERFSDGSLRTASFSDSHREHDDFRDCLSLVSVVGELKGKADGEHAKLMIIEIPDDVEWEIDEYDGMEHVAEKHRTWG